MKHFLFIILFLNLNCVLIACKKCEKASISSGASINLFGFDSLQTKQVEYFLKNRITGDTVKSIIFYNQIQNAKGLLWKNSFIDFKYRLPIYGDTIACLKFFDGSTYIISDSKYHYQEEQDCIHSGTVLTSYMVNGILIYKGFFELKK